MGQLIKSYKELIKLPTFEERFRYLSLEGQVGEETYGFDRWLNQRFYRSQEWRQIRNHVILRDSGCDLGIIGRTITDRIIVHHINPILPQDINNATSLLLDPENLICTCQITHDAIHFGDESLLITSTPVERKPNDTIPWR